MRTSYIDNLLSKIDMGLISINKAYEIVRKKYILKQDSKSQQNNFDKDLIILSLYFETLGCSHIKFISKLLI